MNIYFRCTLSLALLISFVSLSPAQSPSPQNVMVPQGTILRLSLQTPVSTNISEVGDPVRAVLYDDVFVGSDLALDRGTEFFGRVSHVKPARRGQRQSELAITFDRMATSYGEESIKTILTAIDDWGSDKKTKSDEEGVARGGRSGGRTLDNVWRGATIGTAAGTAVVLIGRSGGAATAAGVGIAGTLAAAVLLTKGGDLKLNPGTILRVRLEQAVELPVRPTTKKSEPVKPPDK